MEDVVTQNQARRPAVDKVAADQKSLGQPAGMRLHGIFKAQAPLTAIAQQLVKQVLLMRGGDEQDFIDSRHHQGGQRVVDHRLVVHRQQLLADHLGQQVEPGAGTAGEEERVFGDSGYRGIGYHVAPKKLKSKKFVLDRPGKRKTMDPDSPEGQAEKLKAAMRAKVEHPFFYIKRMFGYAKVRYRGLAKNHNRLSVLAAFANLLIGQRYQPA